MNWIRFWFLALTSDTTFLIDWCEPQLQRRLHFSCPLLTSIFWLPVKMEYLQNFCQLPRRSTPTTKPTATTKRKVGYQYFHRSLTFAIDETSSTINRCSVSKLESKKVRAKVWNQIKSFSCSSFRKTVPGLLKWVSLSNVSGDTPVSPWENREHSGARQ